MSDKNNIYIDFDTDAFKQDFLNEYKQYTKEKQEKIKSTVKALGQQLVRDVKGKSPVEGKSRKGSIYPPGTYKKGWRYTTLRNDGNRITVGPVNYGGNASLAHLLELGHKIVRVSGGIKIDTGKRARAFSHIRDPQKNANDKLEKELKKIFEE